MLSDAIGSQVKSHVSHLQRVCTWAIYSFLTHAIKVDWIKCKNLRNENKNRCHWGLLWNLNWNSACKVLCIILVIYCSTNVSYYYK